MLKGRVKVSWLVAGFALFLVSLVVYIYYTYHTTRAEIMESVDARLLNAAASVKHILGDDYLNTMNQNGQINFFDYEVKSRQLSEFAQSLDVAYVYNISY